MITLSDNGVSVDSVNPTFQFGDKITVNFIRFSPDGSIHGRVSEGTATFDFSFGPRSIVSHGANVSIYVGGADSRCATPTFSSVDDFQVSLFQENLPLGIDVSQWQKSVIWSQVSTTGGKAFAFIRATAGKNTPDGQFGANMVSTKGARAENMLLGAYHFAYPESFTAHDEAQKFLSIAGDYIGSGYLPPALDIEDSKKENSYPYRMGKAVLSQWIRDWCAEVEQVAGVKPMIYSTRDYARHYFDDNISQYPFWVATYPCAFDADPGDMKIWSTWTFQQYRVDPATQHTLPSTTTEPNTPGTCSGISGYADLDSFNGDKIGLAALTNRTTVISGPPYITIMPAGGTFANSVKVTISSPTAGTTIRYTIDGTEPTSSSTVYKNSTALTLTSSVTLKAKAFKGANASVTAVKSFTINPPPPLAITPFHPPAGKVKVSYPSGVILQATGGLPPYKWSWTSQAGSQLPPGLTLNGTTGVIAGKPTKAGTFNFTVKVTDTKNQTYPQAVSLTVN